ncbi:hypothetical protein [Streptomyces sp. CB03911]|uniref:hypothetical protein n=1 Tax=Streptomyces sp. CB03911 TaxID=1804758 RepID=UPI00093C659A|nr:hypothetical protein [Streptomyces sp. CB03911]OKI16643.1 hypothetical protein A6A07_11590 [Streptomyces sp. CB03911]
MTEQAEVRLMTRAEFEDYMKVENVDLAERRAERDMRWAELFVVGGPILPMPQPLPRCPVCWAHQAKLTFYRDDPDRVDFTACGHVVRIVNDSTEEQL